MSFTYKDAGVDLAKVKKAHNTISSIISSTYTDRVLSGYGHYAGLFALNDDVLAIHTDGVGTKVMIAQKAKRFDTVGIDCVAMNVNDIICVGAKPLAFVDYIALRKPDNKLVRSIMKGLARGANEANIAIVGGETAIMPDLIAGKDQAFDLAGTVVGIVKKEKIILGNKIKAGDVIIGAESNGLHSNGYTLARKVLLKRFKLNERVKELDATLAAELLRPTRIYVKPVLEILEIAHGLAHITGGAFSKLTRLHADCKFMLDSMPEPRPIFRLIQRLARLDRKEMYRTFNMGIGFCVITSKDYESMVRSSFKKYGIENAIIGRVGEGKGVYINDIRIA